MENRGIKQIVVQKKVIFYLINWNSQEGKDRKFELRPIHKYNMYKFGSPKSCTWTFAKNEKVKV